jgi:hypothetical protein
MATNATTEDIFDKPIVRYPLAATGIFIGSYLMSQGYDSRNIAMLSIIFVGFGLWAVRRVIFSALTFLAIVGVLLSIGGLVAALPVSVAIVIAALIIANGRR